MHYRLQADAKEQPTLQEMTRKAIEVLQKGPEGFVLFVEGGLIDRAHHQLWARMALDETVEFSKAVAVATEMTAGDDTLIVVTSDHAHTMTMAGYPVRGENILGSPRSVADDNKTYTTLSYANGPQTSFGYDADTKSCARLNVTDEDIGKHIAEMRFSEVGGRGIHDRILAIDLERMREKTEKKRELANRVGNISNIFLISIVSRS